MISPNQLFSENCVSVKLCGEPYHLLLDEPEASKIQEWDFLKLFFDLKFVHTQCGAQLLAELANCATWIQ